MNEFSFCGWRGCVLLATCLGLAACVSTPEKSAEPEPAVVTPVAEAAPAPEPQPPIPPKIASPAEQQEAQRAALKVADLLEAGKVEEAHVEIERALEIDPANKLALSFLSQLTADPVAALGETSFPYTVKSGESLSKIAGRYMGDIFQFYILARYNGIAVPRLVPAGQTIRIPGDKPVEVKQAKPEQKALPKSAETKPPKPEADHAKPTEPAPAQPAVVEVHRPAIPPVVESPPAEVSKPAVPEVVVVPPSVPVKAGGTSPPPVFEQTMANPKPGPVQPPEPTPADRAFQRGLREQAQGNNLKAYNAFKEAYALDASNREAHSNADLMHQEIVSDYMRRARAAFAKQDLQGSIKHWDQLLEFDPGNEIALLERQKAIALQERIKSIK